MSLNLNLFVLSPVETYPVMDVEEAYIGTIEAIHQCNLLYLHGINMELSVYGKEDNDSSNPGMGTRILEAIKKFISFVIQKVTELYEWVQKFFFNMDKKIATLKSELSSLNTANDGVPRELLVKYDNMNRPDFKKCDILFARLKQFTSQETIDKLVSLVSIANTGSNVDVNISNDYSKTINSLRDSTELMDVYQQTFTKQPYDGIETLYKVYVEAMISKLEAVSKEAHVFNAGTAKIVQTLKTLQQLDTGSKNDIHFTMAFRSIKKNSGFLLKQISSVSKVVTGLSFHFFKIGNVYITAMKNKERNAEEPQK